MHAETAPADGLSGPRTGRIVVGVDGSPIAMRALMWAAAEAELRGAVLEIVHADFFRRVALEALAPDLLDGEESILDTALAKAKSLAPNIEVTGQICDPPAGKALLAASDGADMLVVGSRGLSGLREFTLGRSAASAPTTPIAPSSSSAHRRRPTYESGLSATRVHRPPGDRHFVSRATAGPMPTEEAAGAGLRAKRSSVLELLDGLGPSWLEQGLVAAEVAVRVRGGAVNRSGPSASQSWAQILRRNSLTRLNLLLVALGGATLATGSAPDATFLAIAVVNTVVGTVEETRAKRTLDALAVINAPHARVIRDGQQIEIPAEEVVVDDLLDLRPGDQLTADAIVVADSAEVDESLATGESEPVGKVAGDRLVSGSWVVAGALRARATGVGPASYANQLAEQARRYSLAGSELVTGINRVLRWLSWIMVVIAPVLFVRELQSQPWRLAVRLTVAGLVGMIPEGLVLLTTLAFLAAALRLARRQVLIQELPAVETLARVDALCVDKTGTLTEGGVSVGGVTVAGAARSDVESALAALADSRAANATMRAICTAFPQSGGWMARSRIPFSSARKWSAADFADHGTWVLGGPEVIDAVDPEGLRPLGDGLAEQGSRVLALACGEVPPHGELMPAGLRLVALVELREQVRPQVTDTLSYFADQGVTVRVISGDNPATVRALAERVALPAAERAVDARSLPADGDSFSDAVEENRVFGRVTPEQKQAMVQALQARGHTVAMTGDGVNDVLALKEADLGVAMGSGSPITRGVAQVVMRNDDFDALPSVVAEGRRVLANIELVAVLFLVKNVYSLLISVAVSITGWPYPFLPRHLTLISAVGIGIPGFLLALGPNDRRFVPGFLRRVLTLSAVAGAVTAVAVLTTYAIARSEGLSGDASRTAAIIVTVVVTLWVLWIVCRPVTAVRTLLVTAMAGLFVAAYLIPGISSFFLLQHRPSVEVTIEALALGAAAAVVIDLLFRWRPIRQLTRAETDRDARI